MAAPIADGGREIAPAWWARCPLLRRAGGAIGGDLLGRCFRRGAGGWGGADRLHHSHGLGSGGGLGSSGGLGCDGGPGCGGGAVDRGLGSGGALMSCGGGAVDRGLGLDGDRGLGARGTRDGLGSVVDFGRGGDLGGCGGLGGLGGCGELGGCGGLGGGGGLSRGGDLGGARGFDSAGGIGRGDGRVDGSGFGCLGSGRGCLDGGGFGGGALAAEAPQLHAMPLRETPVAVARVLSTELLGLHRITARLGAVTHSG